VSIGETLARARRDAGLSVADISNRTRIRQRVIERIEHDDYPARGIDIFARSEIRQIAQAVGIDSTPLIEEYDAARQPARPSRHPAPPSREPAALSPAGKAYEAIRSAVAELRQANWILRLGLALLAIAALGGFLLVRGTSGHQARQAFAAAQHRTGHAAMHLARSQHRSPAYAARSPGSSSSPTPTTSQDVQVLVPAAIAAFGPGGTGQGDSPQLAHLALDGKAATPWHSDWYATSHFGNLQSGTGLLLDMGRTVTITSASIALSNGLGASLSLRVGNRPVLADLQPVAHAPGIGNVVQLRPSPTRGRYVLVWFTRLPPDQTGTFQASVYDIKVLGHR